MNDSTRDLLVRGTAAARAGDAKEARFFLEWLLDMDADLDEKIEAWYWLAQVSEDPAQKRDYLENVLANRPFHLLARKELMVLDGKLDPADEIDPNQASMQIHPRQDPETINFTCPQCGGRMVYTPDGSSLTCEYCEVRNHQKNGHQAGSQDFLISMATRKGHSTLAGNLVGTCPGCGAEFVLPGQTISIHCPYCNSVFVSNQVETHERIAPAIIYPAKVSQQAAEKILQNWLKKEDISTPLIEYQFEGIYLPVWSFAMGGEMGYHYVIEDDNNHHRQLFNASKTILRSDILIPASSKLAQELKLMINATTSFEKTDYLPDFLAGWAAESYTVSVSDASLDARSITIGMEKQAISLSLPAEAEDLQLDTHELCVDSFQLALMPVWLAVRDDASSEDQSVIDALHGCVIDLEGQQTGLKGLWNWITGAM